MARNSAARPVRAIAVVAGWVAAAVLVQAVLDGDIGAGTRQLEQGIEQRLEGGPPPARTPDRANEGETFEPWELVGV